MLNFREPQITQNKMQEMKRQKRLDKRARTDQEALDTRLRESGIH